MRFVDDNQTKRKSYQILRFIPGFCGCGKVVAAAVTTTKTNEQTK